jgi:hypothetical protein
LDLTPSRSYPAAFIFQKLKSLTMNIRDDSGFKKAAQIFDSAPYVEKLEIKLNCMYLPSVSLDLTSLVFRHCDIHRRAFVPIARPPQTSPPPPSPFHPGAALVPHRTASYHHTRHDHPPHLFRNTKNTPEDLHNPLTETASLLLCAPPTRSPPSGGKPDTGCT